jgi:DNA (cytosine-5)-methyltransferase 1
VEAQGYEVEVLSIPACAVNAPHRRERYWIVGRRVADAKTQGYQRHGRWGMGNGTNGRQEPDGSATTCRQNDMADAGRLESGQDEPQYTESDSRNEAWLRMSCAGCQTHWDNFVWLPCADGKVRRAIDDTFGLVDGLHRSILGALGNSIVPQVAERVIAAMVRADKAESYD